MKLGGKKEKIFITETRKLIKKRRIMEVRSVQD